MSFLTHLYANAMQNPYDVLWNVVGFGGQGIFGVRMFIQWLKSEKEGHSVIPIAFWYCSLFGGLILFSYAVHLRAWPLVLGQGLPLPIYVRNLWMIYRDRKPGANLAQTDEDSHAARLPHDPDRGARLQRPGAGRRGGGP